jgi:hypothetical protein
MSKHPKTDDVAGLCEKLRQAGEVDLAYHHMIDHAAALEEKLARYERLGTRPPVDPDEVQLLEVELPVGMDDEFRRELDKILGAMCKRYEKDNPGRVMWVMGHGQKPRWSVTDALFLGRTPEMNAPADGEPTWDARVYFIELYEREDIHNTNPAPSHGR